MTPLAPLEELAERVPVEVDEYIDRWYAQAAAMVIRDQKPSTSYVQRKLQLSYDTALAIMDRMEREGLVTARNRAGIRQMIPQNARKDGSSK
jgi:S-DNA-T family DNA segregation ATPase FtsK/SpoIIIE